MEPGALLPKEIASAPMRILAGLQPMDIDPVETGLDETMRYSKIKHEGKIKLEVKLRIPQDFAIQTV